MVAKVKLATPDPSRGRKPAPRVRASLRGVLTPGLKAALDAVRAQGGSIPRMLEDA